MTIVVYFLKINNEQYLDYIMQFRNNEYFTDFNKDKSHFQRTQHTK